MEWGGLCGGWDEGDSWPFPLGLPHWTSAEPMPAFSKRLSCPCCLTAALGRGREGLAMPRRGWVAGRIQAHTQVQFSRTLSSLCLLIRDFGSSLLNWVAVTPFLLHLLHLKFDRTFHS